MHPTYQSDGTKPSNIDHFNDLCLDLEKEAGYASSSSPVEKFAVCVNVVLLAIRVLFLIAEEIAEIRELYNMKLAQDGLE